MAHTDKGAALQQAAPELLEALEGLLRAGYDNGVFNDSNPLHVQQRLQEARRAIVRARGRGVGALLAADVISVARLTSEGHVVEVPLDKVPQEVAATLGIGQ